MVKVALLGIDGATWRIVKPLVKKGKLPGFARVMKEGAHGTLRSTTPPVSPAAWTTIFTGVGPGRHNIFNFVRRKKDSYFVTPVSSRDRTFDPIWKTLTDNGVRGVFLNIPFAYPPDRVNGVMTTGLGTPSRDSEFTHPPSLRKDILKRFADFDVDFNEDTILLGTSKDPRGEIERVSRAQVETAKYLWRSQEWDIFATVFRSTDVIQHYYLDDDEAIAECYALLDGFISWAADRLGDDTVMILVSDHGFSRVKWRFMVNNWLENMGLLVMKDEARSGANGLSAESVQAMLLRLGLRDLVWKIKRSGLAEPVLRRILRSERAGHMFLIDWGRTRAYYQDGSYGCITFNMAGREPEGIVKIDEVDGIANGLIQNAGKLEGPDDQPVITRAMRGVDACPGDAPDIPEVVILAGEGISLSGGYDREGRLFVPADDRCGEHDMDGLIGALGPGVAKAAAIKEASVEDITPTMFRALGVKSPKPLDGKALDEVFTFRDGESAHSERMRMDRGIAGAVKKGKM